MPRARERTDLPETVVELRGGIADDLVGYAREKVAAVLTHTAEPVRRSRVRVVRHLDPARERPVTAQADIELDGHILRAHAEASTPREAVDGLMDRLRHRLEGMARHWEARRGRVDHGEPHEWRHGFPPSPHQGYRELPADERQIIRHATTSPRPCSVDDAVTEMTDLDHEFHLFVEATTGVDAVVYRTPATGTEPAGFGLALTDGRMDLVPEGSVEVSAIPDPAPLLDVPEAVARLELTGMAWLFFLDADHGRGCVLFRRRDGHYGLIDPLAAPVSRP